MTNVSKWCCHSLYNISLDGRLINFGTHRSENNQFYVMQMAVECAQRYMMMDCNLMSFCLYEIRDMTSHDRKKNAYYKEFYSIALNFFVQGKVKN